MFKLGFLLLSIFGISLFIFANGNLINEDPDEFVRKHLSQETRAQIEFLIATSFIKRLEDLKGEIGIDNVLLPELNETYPIGDTYLYVAEGTPWSGIIEGEINFCDSTLYGADTIMDRVEFDLDEVFLGNAGLHYNITAGEISLSGQTSLGLRILLGLLRVLGFGEYNVGVNGGFVDLNIAIRVDLINNNFTMLDFGLDIGFNNTTFYCDEGILNEVEIDFDQLNYEIKDTFDAFWPVLKYLIDDGVRDIINVLFKNCTLAELIGLDFTCIGTKVTDEMIQAQIDTLLSPIEVEATADCSTRTSYRTVPPKATEPPTEIPDATEGAGLIKLSLYLFFAVATINYFL